MQHDPRATRPQASQNNPPANCARPGHTDPILRAEQINLELVGAFLASKDYSISEGRIEQPWRHVVVVIDDSRQGRQCFFKLASTPEIGICTANEVRFNQTVGSKLREVSQGRVFCPEIYEVGKLGGNTYYIAEYIEGKKIKPLKSDLVEDCSYLQALLPGIANIADALTKCFEVEAWSRFTQPTNLQDVANYHFRNWPLWTDATRAYQAPEQIILLGDKLRRNFRPMLAHGDFSIGNILLVENSFVLVDGEHAYFDWPAWYDIANMAYRLGTRGALQLGQSFIDQMTNKLSKPAPGFMDELIGALAFCAVRGFYELQVDRKEGLAVQKKLDFANYVVRLSESA